MPELVDWFPNWTGYTASSRQVTKLHGAIQMFIDRCRNSRDLDSLNEDATAKETPSNFVEAWVWKIWRSRNDPSSSFHGQAGGKNHNIFR